jgi:hypothetical protein
MRGRKRHKHKAGETWPGQARRGDRRGESPRDIDYVSDAMAAVSRPSPTFRVEPEHGGEHHVEEQEHH